MNSLECKYCKYYEYDSEMTKVYWKLTQDDEENVPKIGRCTFANKTCGNAVLSEGARSDGKRGCNAFEHRGITDNLPYKKYDVFEWINDNGKNTVVWIDRIQYEYAPYLYRLCTIGHGGWSATEEQLSDESKYRFMWEQKAESEE